MRYTMLVKLHPFYAEDGRFNDERGEPCVAGWYVHTPDDVGIPSGPYESAEEALSEAMRQVS